MRVIVTTIVALSLASAGVTSRAQPAPRSGPLFGMDVPSLAALGEAESALHTRAQVIGLFADWAHAPDFPRGDAGRIAARGAFPLISWEPWDAERGGADQPEYALDTIAAGEHDGLIDRWAAQIAAFRSPVMLRFAPEMNGDWLPWSEGVNGNGAGDYVAAWRHVRERFRRAGATNAVWVWNPIAAYDGSTPLTAVFPGADEVDWVAVDGYNWGSTRAWGWQSYEEVFAPTITALRELAPQRPLMIAETGCAPDARKPAWIRATFAAARADGVAALVWFEFAKETDWRLTADDASARAARTALRSWR
jgi:beta-mannanase